MMIVETPEPSDQQPEEGPSEQVAEDKQDPSDGASEKDGDGDDSRDAGRQATGNPANAG